MYIQISDINKGEQRASSYQRRFLSTEKSEKWASDEHKSVSPRKETSQFPATRVANALAMQ